MLTALATLQELGPVYVILHVLVLGKATQTCSCYIFVFVCFRFWWALFIFFSFVDPGMWFRRRAAEWSCFAPIADSSQGGSPSGWGMPCTKEPRRLIYLFLPCWVGLGPRSCLVSSFFLMCWSMDGFAGLGDGWAIRPEC